MKAIAVSVANLAGLTVCLVGTASAIDMPQADQYAYVTLAKAE